MPTKTNSPYAQSFNSSIKRGTPCHQAVWNISKRTNTPVNTVYQSLYKAGLVNRQKFNGQWLYWANEAVKTPAKNWKESQFNAWQWFVDWALANGFCTPEQLANNKGSQQDFMKYCKKFWGKQFNATTTNTGRTRKNTSAKGRKTTKSRKSNNSSYSFPKAKSTTRRYRRAA